MDGIVCWNWIWMKTFDRHVVGCFSVVVLINNFVSHLWGWSVRGELFNANKLLNQWSPGPLWLVANDMLLKLFNRAEVQKLIWFNRWALVSLIILTPSPKKTGHNRSVKRLKEVLLHILFLMIFHWWQFDFSWMLPSQSWTCIWVISKAKPTNLKKCREISQKLQLLSKTEKCKLQWHQFYECTVE